MIELFNSLIFISHKEIWQGSRSQADYMTIGGFPFHVKAISEIFDQTHLLICLRQGEVPNGAIKITGKNLIINPLPEPKGKNFRRKLSLLIWIPKNIKHIWNGISEADVVHAAVPGDIGVIGLLIALLQRKPLFVRHCGTWGEPQTLVDRLLFWLLEKIASNRNIVFATGGGMKAPSDKNPNIQWIFSTSLTQDEFVSVKIAEHWKKGESLKMVTVARLSPEKNVMAIIEALPGLVQQGLDVRLAVVGDGSDRQKLADRVRSLDLEDRVRFYGNVDHDRVLEILSESHLFVFPTRVKEGFPKAVLEAMACGLPVITSPVSVLPYLIKDQGCGILLEGTDGESVAASVLEMISDPQMMCRMGENARAAAKNYTLEKWRDQIGEVLESSWGVKLREQ